MDVAVDQPRHEGPAAHVDDRRAGGADRPGRDLTDAGALDQDRHAVLELGLRRVEELCVLEEDEAHRTHPQSVTGPRGPGAPALCDSGHPRRNGRRSTGRVP